MNQPLTPNLLLQNRYQIERLLGQGGMGAVYRASDLRLSGHVVAVKENFETAPEAQTQFQTEATLLANLQHPMLPRVTDHFVEPSGRQYLVMDFVEGDDLERIVMQRGAIPEAQAILWLTQILNALEYLHTRTPPIIHRDIKPSNIKIRPDGRAMLVDFGIAKIYYAGQKTVASAQAYSPGYSPLEQYGHGSTDARSDIYSLGATLYFVVTARTPPEARDLATGAETLTPPSRLNRHTTPTTETALLKAMTMQPMLRYQTAGELRDALNPRIGTQRVSTQPALSNVAANMNLQPSIQKIPTPIPSTPVPPPARVAPPARPKPAPSSQTNISAGRYIGTVLACGIGFGILETVFTLLTRNIFDYGWVYTSSIGFLFSIPGVLAYLILRRPGAALLANFLALTCSIVVQQQGDFSNWGIYSSSITIEAVFALTRYRGLSIRLAVVAAVVSDLAAWGASMVQFSFAPSLGDLVLEVIASAVGGAVAFGLWKRFFS